jgi:hypothetical protein
VASTQRLRDRWIRLTSLPRRLFIPVALATAAAIGVLALGGWLWWHAASAPSVQIGQITSPPPAITTTVEVEARLPGRAPTPLEVALLQAHVRKMALAKSRAAASPKHSADQTAQTTAPAPPSAPTVDSAPPPTPTARLLQGNTADLQAYLQRVADPRTRADALQTLDRMSPPPTERLLQVLTGPRADLRIPAALALGRIDGPVLTRRLVEMIHLNQSRREAFIALASSRGREARAYVRRAAAESEQYAGLARSAMIASEVQ